MRLASPTLPFSIRLCTNRSRLCLSSFLCEQVKGHIFTQYELDEKYRKVDIKVRMGGRTDVVTTLECGYETLYLGQGNEQQARDGVHMCLGFSLSRFLRQRVDNGALGPPLCNAPGQDYETTDLPSAA
jgi:hypothetical protein